VVGKHKYLKIKKKQTNKESENYFETISLYNTEAFTFNILHKVDNQHILIHLVYYNLMAQNGVMHEYF